MYTAGIDIGGTNTRIALIDEAYEIIERIQFPTDVNNPQATLQKIQEAVQGFSVAIAGVGLSLSLIHIFSFQQARADNHIPIKVMTF